MSQDRQLAKPIYDAIDAFNKAAQAAREAGLRVTLEYTAPEELNTFRYAGASDLVVGLRVSVDRTERIDRA